MEASGAGTPRSLPASEVSPPITPSASALDVGPDHHHGNVKHAAAPAMAAAQAVLRRRVPSIGRAAAASSSVSIAKSKFAMKSNQRFLRRIFVTYAEMFGQKQTAEAVVRLAAPADTALLLHPPLPLVGVSIRTERGCQQNGQSRQRPGPRGLHSDRRGQQVDTPSALRCIMLLLAVGEALILPPPPPPPFSRCFNMDGEGMSGK